MRASTLEDAKMDCAATCSERAIEVAAGGAKPERTRARTIRATMNKLTNVLARRPKIGRSPMKFKESLDFISSSNFAVAAKDLDLN